MTPKLLPRILLKCLLLFAASVAVAAPPSTQPSPRALQFPWMSVSSWYEQHAADVALAEQGQARVVFLGDSITQGWDSELWQQHFAPLGAVNFAIGGDLTQNMLWRLQHGDVEKLNPDLLVVLAGVNNYLRDRTSPENTFLGVQALVIQALDVYPNAHLILHGIFPFGAEPNTAERQWVNATNTLLQELGNLERVDYYDIGDYFLEADGSLSPSVMPDFLHPGSKGYKIWLEHLLPRVQSSLKALPASN